MDDIGEDDEEQEEEVDEEDDSDSEGSDEDGDDGDDSNEEEEDVELRRKIEEALKVNGIEAATEDSEEEELMDDDQMMAIDAQLAAAFKSRTEEKKGPKSRVFLHYYLSSC
jgi:DNA polymerase phi